MSDTIIFGKTFRASLKATWLYVAVAFCLTAGAAMMNLTHEQWTSYWIIQKIGWWTLLIGNCFNTFKAATSSSTRPTQSP